MKRFIRNISITASLVMSGVVLADHLALGIALVITLVLGHMKV